uniref:Uncharacterized protein n=1 Tax=Globisporangium ultimum (strain ATCC 200006 / CBS 805.95 / DAOM BR144) TaxID=431595 RepID=K3XBG5_GLOUD
MVGMRTDAASAPVDVFAWLVRRQREDVGVEAALDAIRSACGSVPLGGRASSVRSRGSALTTATTASNDKDVFWQIVLNCCDLPASADPEQRKTALQQLATTLDKKKSAKKTDGDADGEDDSKFTWQAIARIRNHYYAERKAFFMVRIELLRTVLFVQPDQHPNFHVVEEIVDDLMKEGLLEALFDEFAGRQLSIAHRPNFFALPDQSPIYSHHQHQAQQAWEVQFLEEEALLRQLLLLALYYSKEKLDFSKAVQTTKALHSWDDCIVPDVFSSSTLALPKSQEKLVEAAHLGAMVSIRMLHQVSLAPFSRPVWGEVFDLSRTFVLGDIGNGKSEANDQFLPSESTCGVLLLAWASVLAHQYHHHRSTVPDDHQLESLLQETLALAENKHGFYQLNVLLRTLVFADDSQDADHSYPFLQAVEMDDKLAWQLPVVTGLQASKKYRKGGVGLGRNGYRVSIFQHVAADFLNDMLVSLGYLDNLENLHQLSAMTKLVSPVLANPHVAEQTLFSGDTREHSASDGLTALIHKSKEVLPRSLLSYIRLYTALCSSTDGSSSSSVLRQVLKEFGKQVSLEAADVLAPRLLPPNDYFAEVDDTGTIKCKRSFYYGDDQLAIPAGTFGQIVELDPTFVHDRRADEAALWSSKHFHFLSAAIAALSALTSVDSCVEIIIGELRGGTEECVNLIIKTSRKLFEYHERIQGSYPVVISTLDIVMNLVRWFLSREASALGADQVDSSRNGFWGHEFISAERNWFVGAVEFAIEILSAHESWKFSTIATKWDLTERCFRPGFLAYLLFDTASDSSESEKKTAKTQQLVALLERFLIASEQLLEEATDLFCEVLKFLVQVWKGATKYGLAVHVEIAGALRSSTNFWQNLTRALKIRMSLDVDDANVAIDMDLTGDGEGNAANAYRGRSSPYGSVQAYSKNSHGIMTSVDTDNTRLPVYQEGLICDTALLQWQLKRNNVDGRGITGAVVKRVKWSNLQAAYVQAQNFALGKWKVFMELCCLQAGGSSESNGPGSTTNGDAEPIVTNRFKRKESMISSPPRLSTRRVTPPSPLDLRAGDSSSNFSGDRTSYGMIQVLSDVISARQGNSALDYFALTHLQHLVELLVSMLHHQFCLVLQKTRDPKYSHTQQRKQLNEPRLTLQKSLKLLSLVENAMHNVDLSANKIKTDMDVDALLGADEMQPNRTPGLWQRLAGDFTEKIDSIGVKLRTSLLTASLLLVRHIVAVRKDEPELSSPGLWSGERDEAQATSILQVKLVHHCMNSIKVCDQHADSASLRELFQVSWCLFQEILDGFVHTTTTARNQKLRLDSYVTLRPLVTLLEHEQNGLTVLFEILIQRFRSKANQSGSSEARAEQRSKQEQALNVLKGLTAVVWNSKNRDLCQRVMVDSSTSELRLLPLLATQLIPLLRAQMDQEQSGSGHHGYVISDATEESFCERSVAHEMWCTLLRFVAGLLKLLSAEQQIRFSHQEGNVIWEFIAHGEPLMLLALHPQTRLTRARVEEQLSILCFLNAVSGSEEMKKQWKQGLPRNFALMMEQSRLLLRRACVLLGSSLSETKKLQQRKTASKSIVGIATSPSAASSLSSFSFSHQTLLHEHLQAVQADDKRRLTEFYRTMEIELAEVARQTSFLLMKWTASLTSQDSMVVIDGARYIDEEKLLPLLTFTPSNQALSMSCEPCLGHLCVVMEFLVAQLEYYAETSKHPSNASPLVFGNTVNTCALLFLKTYLLHNEQYEVSKDDQDEFNSFFQRLNERISSAGASVQARVDCELLRHIEQVIKFYQE